MRVIGLAGWSGAGKTTLLTRLLPVLVGQGLSVSTLKHAHHAFDVDQPGKDSHAHREAGASEVLVASGRRWALMHELRAEREPTLAELLVRLSPVDLVIVEGFKRAPHPKLIVHRAANGEPLLADCPGTIAFAADEALPDAPCPVLPLDDTLAIAALLRARALPLPATLALLTTPAE